MKTNPRRSLANRCNSLKSIGPRSASGKRASSQISRKHGLNSAPDFECWSECRALVNLIAGEGFSASADIASSPLNYRRIMGAYSDTYTSPVPVDKFLRDVNVKASNPVSSEFLGPLGSEPQGVREMAGFFARMQRQERRKGGPVSRRSSDAHRLIRFQRNGISRLTGAIRQG